MLFGGVQFAVLGGADERDIGVGGLVAEINFAAGERLGINVDTDGALVKLRQVHDFVHRFDRIHVGGMRGVEIVSVRRNNFARAVSGVATVHAIVLNTEAADGPEHPPVLVAIVVYAAVLAYFPPNAPTL